MGGSAKTWVLGIALLGVGQNCRSGDFFYQNPQHPAPVFSPGVRHSIAPSLPHLDSPARIEVPARPELGTSPGRTPLSSAKRAAFATPDRPALDLRPPETKPDADAEIAFPSRPHSMASTEPSSSEAPQFHFQGSRVRQFAERFHHEGLPVARLWETHSALLSLGLNQRGKPGLWLIQKTH
jgi:hypothetical protein